MEDVIFQVPKAFIFEVILLVWSAFCDDGMVYYTIVKVDVTATATPKKGDDFLVRGHE